MPCQNACPILVVEDNQEVRELEVALLETEGYEVTSASNGKEALDLLSSIKKPCVVLLDLMMPVMNGRQFLSAIKEDTALSPIPVVIVSAVSDRSDTAGAVGFVPKPIKIDELLDNVSRFCRH